MNILLAHVFRFCVPVVNSSKLGCIFSNVIVELQAISFFFTQSLHLIFIILEPRLEILENVCVCVYNYGKRNRIFNHFVLDEAYETRTLTMV